MPPGDVPAVVPTGSTPAAAARTVPVPTILCVVLGLLLCLALGALAVQAYRGWVRRRGGSPVGGCRGRAALGGSRGFLCRGVAQWGGQRVTAMAPGERCLWFQVAAEPQTPSPTPSTRSSTIP